MAKTLFQKLLSIATCPTAKLAVKNYYSLCKRLKIKDVPADICDVIYMRINDIKRIIQTENISISDKQAESEAVAFSLVFLISPLEKIFKDAKIRVEKPLSWVSSHLTQVQIRIMNKNFKKYYNESLHDLDSLILAKTTGHPEAQNITISEVVSDVVRAKMGVLDKNDIAKYKSVRSTEQSEGSKESAPVNIVK